MPPPDLNSLPPSPSPTGAASPSHSRTPTSAMGPGGGPRSGSQDRRNSNGNASAGGGAGSASGSPSSPSSHSASLSHSLAAAAALNAGIQHDMALGSRRSSVASASGAGVFAGNGAAGSGAAAAGTGGGGNGNSGSMAQAASRNRGIERRRSSVRINLTHNDPTIPSPGEMAMSPGAMSRHGSMSFNNGGGGMGGGHAGGPHGRTPSLGELHQELENEQEFQVNRLLNMIRQQQAQITNLTAAAAPNNAGSSGPASATAAGHAASAIAIDDSTTPTSERSMSLPHHPAGHPQQGPLHAAPRARSPAVVPQQQQGQFPPQPASRTSSYGPGARSRGSSRVGSPALRPGSASSGTAVAMAGAGAPAPGVGVGEAGSEWLLGGSQGAGRERDESAFYQAETQMLTRENQMLKLRIRELERQLAEATNPTSPITHTPTTHSNLATAPPFNSPSASRDNLTATPELADAVAAEAAGAASAGPTSAAAAVATKEDDGAGEAVRAAGAP